MIPRDHFLHHVSMTLHVLVITSIPFNTAGTSRFYSCSHSLSHLIVSDIVSNISWLNVSRTSASLSTLCTNFFARKTFPYRRKWLGPIFRDLVVHYRAQSLHRHRVLEPYLFIKIVSLSWLFPPICTLYTTISELLALSVLYFYCCFLSIWSFVHPYLWMTLRNSQQGFGLCKFRDRSRDFTIKTELWIFPSFGPQKHWAFSTSIEISISSSNQFHLLTIFITWLLIKQSK